MRINKFKSPTGKVDLDEGTGCPEQKKREKLRRFTENYATVRSRSRNSKKEKGQSKIE